ncbi:MAG TPA: histidine kinase [Gemmatimonadaceae bacterium]|nr:histidine kinase [Gemmatimonadaceae bacterium]
MPAENGAHAARTGAASAAAGPRWLGWAVAFGVATLLTLFFPLQHHIADLAHAAVARRLGERPPPVQTWMQRLPREALAWYGWLGVAAVTYVLSRRYPLLGPRRNRHLAIHVPAALVLTALLTVVLVLVQPPGLPWKGITFGETVLLVYLRYFGTWLLLYAGIVGVQHAVLYYRAYESRAMQASQLEARLANAQLDALKMQLDPHFLFNTLNTISSLMFRDVYAAQEMIVRLSGLLRTSLESSARHEVPLEDELAFLDQYVEIQKVRFRDRLTLVYDVDDAARRMLVPRLILQPLVENAIRHGIGDTAGAGRIEVRAHAEDGTRLVLEVLDSGRGTAAMAEEGRAGGIGLKNTRTRLRQLYGPNAALVFRDVEPHGVAVRVELPARAAADSAPVVPTALYTPINGHRM